jgi:hypothetical protein
MPSGKLDTTFGKSGVVSLGNDLWGGLALQPDKKILAGGGGSFAGWTLSRLIGDPSQ